MFGKVNQDELLREIVALRGRITQLEDDRVRALRLDGLTGVLGARGFRGRLAEEVERARRYNRPLSVAVVGIDHFAELERRDGFRAGDELLVAAASRLRGAVRSHDLLGRTGQAEFCLLLPETPAAPARASLERLLIELELIGEGRGRAVGASMGIAALHRGSSAEGLLAEARQACGRAQALGGGRAVVAAAPGPGSAATELARARAESGEDAPQHDAVEALAVALLERDRYTGEHSEAVIGMAVAVARNLGCSPAEIERVRSAALLHDIGKVAIPDEILHKPGPLSDPEWLLMREHPVIGERILRVLPGLGAVARIVRHEHERWDGGGYPDGLSGESIPLGSRIIIVADTYHAITSDRPYRAARSHAEAVAELAGCAGTQFDPRITETLIGHLYGRRQAGRVAV